MSSIQLRVAAPDRPPFVFLDTARVGNAQFYGLLPDLLPVLLSYGGQEFDNVTLSYYPVASAGGTQFPNGSWSGVMGELISGRADIAAFPLSLTEPRSEYVDLTYSYFNGGIGILVSAAQQKTDALSFLKPFAWQLWLAILAVLLGVALFSNILSRLSPLRRYEVKRLRRLDVDHLVEAEYVVESANDSVMMEACVTQLGQMPQPRSRSWAVRLLILAHGAFCVIILATYTANLAAFLTAEQLAPQINSPLTLLRSGGNFAVSAAGSTYTYFITALDPVAAALVPKMRVYTDSDAAVAAVQDGTVKAFLTDYPTLQYYADQLPCDVTVAGNSFGPSSLSLGLQLDSALLDVLNPALLQVESNGVLDQLIRKWTTDISQCNSGTTVGTTTLAVRDLCGLFYMVLLALALSLLFANTALHLTCWLNIKLKGAIVHYIAIGAGANGLAPDGQPREIQT